MKIKSLIVALVLAVSVISVNAQNFKVGDQVVNAGIGLGSALGGGLPLAISYEKGIKDGILDKGVLSVGGYVGYTSYTEDLIFYKLTNTYITLGVRGILHYAVIDNSKLDTYAGLLVGYNVYSAKFDPSLPGLSGSASTFGKDLFIGGRYSFTDKISGMAELGFGITYLTVGIGYKL